MNLEHISDKLKQQSSIGLPILCFSITDNNLHITTKKVASRFFEHLNDKTKYIEFRVKHRLSCSIDELESGLEFYDYILEYFDSNSIITTNQFLEILNIQNITDIANKEFSKKWNLFFVIRDPLIRLLSGFTELVDSMLIEDNFTDNKSICDIINQYSHKDELFGLKYFTTSEANQILNYFSKKIHNVITNDEHTSNWNTFITYLLSKVNGEFKIIDIDNPTDMRIYGKDESETTNKKVYLNWLNDESNNKHINDFFNTLDYFIISEYNNYLSLISQK